MKPLYSVVMPYNYYHKIKLANKLLELGYRQFSEQDGDFIVTYKDGDYLFTSPGVFGNCGQTYSIRLENYNFELFEALIVQSADTDKGNWFIHNGNPSNQPLITSSPAFTPGKLYKCILPSIGKTGSCFIDNNGNTNGYAFNRNDERFTKATAEQIIEHFTTSTTQNMKDQNQAVTVCGNQYLLKALEQELLANGYRCSSWNSDWNCIYITSDDNEIVGSNLQRGLEFQLPEDYEAAKKHLLSFIKPDMVKYKLQLTNCEDEIAVFISKETILIEHKSDITKLNPGRLINIAQDLIKFRSHAIGGWIIEIPSVKIGCQTILTTDILEIYNLYLDIVRK